MGVHERVVLLASVIMMTACQAGTEQRENEALQSLSQVDRIELERSAYGLLFTDIQVDGRSVKAMVDFGDARTLLIASTVAEERGLMLEATGLLGSDVHGNTWPILRGTASEVRIGTMVHGEMPFGVQPGELESVSEQVGTEVGAVLGWGYFANRPMVLDLSASRIELPPAMVPWPDVDFALAFDTAGGHLSTLVSVDGESTRVLIDTGSPVSVIHEEGAAGDRSVSVKLELGAEAFDHPMYLQDLSILADLGVSAIVGADVLELYRIQFDPDAMLLRGARH